MEITFDWMTESDIPEISTLAHSIWNQHYPGIISQAQIDYMLERAYSAESLRKQLSAGHQFLLARSQGRIAGFLAIAPLTLVEEPAIRGENVMPHDHMLHKFYIAPEAQGKGLGSKMLQELQRRRPEIKKLRLQVARKNESAWKFYQKQGFTIDQSADFDIGLGFRMEDYVMEKRIA